MRDTHELKTWVEPFKEVWSGRKTAELRKADRDFKKGDVIRLKEWKPRKKQFTGRYIDMEITHIVWIGQWVPGVEEPYVMLSMRPL